MHIVMSSTSLLALIDSGSTHNFIAAEAAGHANLPTLTQGQLRVIVANGERVQCPDVYRNAPFSVNTEEFQADFYGLPLAGYDVILGTQWLATLGPVLWDFGVLTMSFWRGGRQLRWSGTASIAGPTVQSYIATDFLSAILDEFAPRAGHPRDACHPFALLLTPLLIRAEAGPRSPLKP